MWFRFCSDVYQGQIRVRFGSDFVQVWLCLVERLSRSGSDVVQLLYRFDSGLARLGSKTVQFRFRFGSCWARLGAKAVQMWFRFGSRFRLGSGFLGFVHMRFMFVHIWSMCSSDVVYGPACLTGGSGLDQSLFSCGSGLDQVRLRCCSGLVQIWFIFRGPDLVQIWKGGGSHLVQVWSMFDSGLVHMWVRHYSYLVQCWHVPGSDSVQVWFVYFRFIELGPLAPGLAGQFGSSSLGSDMGRTGTLSIRTWLS